MKEYKKHKTLPEIKTSSKILLIKNLYKILKSSKLKKSKPFNGSQPQLAKQIQAEKRKLVLVEEHPQLEQKPGKPQEVQQVSRD